MPSAAKCPTMRLSAFGPGSNLWELNPERKIEERQIPIRNNELNSELLVQGQ